jgi:general secretion pathway protein K
LTAGELSPDDATQTSPGNSDNELAGDAPPLVGVFEIMTEAHLADGSSASLSVLVERLEGVGITPFTVLKWQRNQHLEHSLFLDDKTNLLVKQYAEPEFNN